MRATRPVHELDAHLRTACAPPPEPPTVLPGPLTGRTLEACTSGPREPGSGPDDADAEADDDVGVAHRRPPVPAASSEAPQPGGAPPRPPGGRAQAQPAHTDGTQAPGTGTPHPRRALPPLARPSLARLHELAGGATTPHRPAPRRRPALDPARAARTDLAGTDPERAAEAVVGGAAARALRRLGAAGTTAPHTPMATGTGDLGTSRARSDRAGLRTAPVRTAPPTGAPDLLRRALGERSANPAATADGVTTTTGGRTGATTQHATTNPAERRRRAEQAEHLRPPGKSGDAERARRQSAPGQGVRGDAEHPAEPDLDRPGGPAHLTGVPAAHPARSAPPADADGPARLTRFAGAPARPARLVDLAGGSDAAREEPLRSPLGSLPRTAADSSTVGGVGGAVPATSAPELERLLDRVLTDAARRHGIEV